MKHRIAGNKFSRDRAQRKALFKSLINSLIINGQIQTTEAKAKRVRVLAEKLINIGRRNDLHSRRQVHSFLQNKAVVGKIVDELGPKFVGYKGGFTRIVKLGFRRGDNAPLARLELLEKATLKLKTEKKEKETPAQAENPKEPKPKKIVKKTTKTINKTKK